MQHTPNPCLVPKHTDPLPQERLSVAPPVTNTITLAPGAPKFCYQPCQACIDATLVDMGYRGDDASRTRADSRRQPWQSSSRTGPGALGSWDDGSAGYSQDDEYSAPGGEYGGYTPDDSYAGYENYGQEGGHAAPGAHAPTEGYGRADGYGATGGYGADRFADASGYKQPGAHAYPGPGAYGDTDGYASGNRYADSGGYATSDGYADSGGYPKNSGYPDNGGYGDSGGYADSRRLRGQRRSRGQRRIPEQQRLRGQRWVRRQRRLRRRRPLWHPVRPARWLRPARRLWRLSDPRLRRLGRLSSPWRWFRRPGAGAVYRRGQRLVQRPAGGRVGFGLRRYRHLRHARRRRLRHRPAPGRSRRQRI